MTTTLTAPETRRFAALEEKVAEHIGSFFEAAKALAEIRDSRLYRETHATFEAYCKARWKMSRSRAYQLIASAEVVETLSTNGGHPAPESERVARPLAKLPKEQREPAWREAVETATDGVTAEHVEAVVASRLSQDKPEPADEAYAEDFLSEQDIASMQAMQVGDCPKGGDHEWAQDDGETYCKRCLEPLDAKAEPAKPQPAKLAQDPPDNPKDTRRRFRSLWTFCDYNARVLIRALANEWPLEGDVD